MFPSRKRKTSRRITKPPTELQELAREFNYTLGFRLNHLYIRPRTFPTSDKTDRAIAMVNQYISEVRESLRSDWREERYRLKLKKQEESKLIDIPL